MAKALKLNKLLNVKIIPFLIFSGLDHAPLWVLYLLLVLFGLMTLTLLVMLCFQLYYLFLDIIDMFEDWLKQLRK